MSKIKTFKGMLAMGVEEKIHLSTNDGLKAYRINRFQIIPKNPGASNAEMMAKIFLTSQTGNIVDTVDFSDTDLLAVAFYQDGSTIDNTQNETIIFDKETFNQDIFIYFTDVSGQTNPGNFYIELELFDIDVNTSTYHTLKNIRSLTGPSFEFL